MKASLKFREDQKPLFRAKVPLNILGFPFQSGIVTGESKELSLNLSTFFDSGPSLKLAYRPNDSLNPFSLVFKTGIGHFGSPISSPMTMSAEFNFIGNQNPSFFVHFRPHFGDFCIKKSQSSNFVKGEKFKQNGAVSDEGSSMEVIETPVTKSNYSIDNGLFYGSTISPPRGSQTASMLESLLSGTEVSARTGLPLRNRAVVNFRWGVRFPAVDEAAETAASVIGKTYRTAGISFRRFPLLVMNKIGIEHVAKDDSKDATKPEPRPGNKDVAVACLDVKKQLEVIQAENGMLRKAMNDLRSELISGKLKPASFTGGKDYSKYKEGERGGVRNSGNKIDRRGNVDNKKSSELNGLAGKSAEGHDVDEELKKAFMGTTADGA